MPCSVLYLLSADYCRHPWRHCRFWLFLNFEPCFKSTSYSHTSTRDILVCRAWMQRAHDLPPFHCSPWSRIEMRKGDFLIFFMFMWDLSARSEPVLCGFRCKKDKEKANRECWTTEDFTVQVKGARLNLNAVWCLHMIWTNWFFYIFAQCLLAEYGNCSATEVAEDKPARGLFCLIELKKQDSTMVSCRSLKGCGRK